MTSAVTSLGVIVGRFQVPRLRRGHRSLIEHVRGANDVTLVFLGVPEFPTSHNPLSYELRKAMFASAYPGVRVEPLHDHPSDEAWLASLEARIAYLFPASAVTLYGSRDSFLKMYRGTYATECVEETRKESGTQHRDKVAASAATYEGIRRGIIRTYEKLIPTVHATVDIALLSQDHARVLLGRKKSEDGLWRFIGGRVDPSDPSAEHAARRELHEEAGECTTGDFMYIGSQKIRDWRYSGSKDGILTTFFCTEYRSGTIVPNDDIHEVRWFDVDQASAELIEDHAPLARMLHAWLARTHHNTSCQSIS